jgi:hypothetical protein
VEAAIALGAFNPKESGVSQYSGPADDRPSAQILGESLPNVASGSLSEDKRRWLLGFSGVAARKPLDCEISPG